ncbi:hypothetical protein KIH79_09170 [Bifidobacterium sp. 82T10]|uniref:Uncharacterized protein n=1 Tax=Bifidobacterium miconis TaxID=2834435 RepID=A0ABS6WGU0_9BIFI|nr:hypothetical protein [Bifidobacterium miconis]MBW3093087.1 hypothetical protein [Bifidobacterium miconis]
MSSNTELVIQSNPANSQSTEIKFNLTPDDPINGRTIMCWTENPEPCRIDWDDAELLWRWLGLILGHHVPEAES